MVPGRSDRCGGVGPRQPPGGFSARGRAGTRDAARATAARRLAAFTLIELLTVIAIMGVLTAVVIGVGRRASESGRIARAKTELAALSAALESYRRQFGDYPQTGAAANVAEAAAAADDGPGILFNALAGKRGPASSLVALDRRVLADFALLTLQDPATQPAHGSSAQLANAFVDPWGRRYLYFYKTGTADAWAAPGFVLYSTGPDGLDLAPTTGTGLLDPTAAGNADNLYANQNG